MPLNTVFVERIVSLINLLALKMMDLLQIRKSVSIQIYNIKNNVNGIWLPNYRLMDKLKQRVYR